MYNLPNLGLIAIAAAWIIQYLHTTHKKHDLQPLFLIFNSLGFLVLTFASFRTASLMTAILYMAISIVSVALLLKASK